MKKHKGIFICLAILLVLGIVAFIGVKKLLYPDSSKNKYGDRLSGIENYKISNELVNEIKEKFLKNEFVTDFNYNLTGRIIKITIKVKEDTKVDDAKKLTSIITEIIPVDYQQYYDISYNIVCSENDNYPIMASKHKTSNEFSWTIKKEIDGEEKGV